MSRILLKLSGEALAGDKHHGFDEATVIEVAKQVKQIVDNGTQVGIVIGGGNFWRGRTSETIDRTKADQIGMLATVMNCIYVSEIFRYVGMKTAVLTPFECGNMTKLFSKDRANKYFAHDMVVFFAGDKHHGFDEATVIEVAKQVKQIVDNGTQVGIVIGGGNFWRGRTSETIDRTKADQIGMLATVMNCIYVSEIFRYVGMKTAVLTPFECGNMTKLFSKDRANKYFAHDMVVFFAGGTGHPYFSTDTATVLRAIEIEADGIYLAKAIDGVYDSDPKTNPAAKKYDELSIEEVVEKKLAVVDLTASIMCLENKMPMYVFGLNEENSIVNALTGKFNGTKVTV